MKIVKNLSLKVIFVRITGLRALKPGKSRYHLKPTKYLYLFVIIEFVIIEFVNVSDKK